jgi:hypothetical protein
MGSAINDLLPSALTASYAFTEGTCGGARKRREESLDMGEEGQD